MLAHSTLFFVMLLVATISRSSAFAVMGSKGLPSRSVRPLMASAHSLTSPADVAFDNYSAKTAFMFPGQGAQYVGMAGEVAASCPAAANLFTTASSILGYDLLKACTDGPKENLDTTAVSQPAIFVSSMAALEKFKADGGDLTSATVACGLSLGEYSALCYAGAISFEDGVRVTKARGAAMQKASDAQETGMVSVIGLSREQCTELCAKASADSQSTVTVANYLCPGNYAVSGSKVACDKVMEIAKPEFKARMTVRLAVAGAFHTDYMSPAVGELEEVLKTVEIKKPRIPVISNVDARPHSDPDVIKRLLALQVTQPVLWENTIEALFEEGRSFEEAFEFGPGKVVAGIVKRSPGGKDKKITNVEV